MFPVVESSTGVPDDPVLSPTSPPISSKIGLTEFTAPNNTMRSVSLGVFRLAKLAFRAAEKHSSVSRGLREVGPAPVSDSRS